MVSQEEILRVMADHGGPISTASLNEILLGPNARPSDIFGKLRKLEVYGIVEKTGQMEQRKGTKSTMWRLK